MKVELPSEFIRRMQLLLGKDLALFENAWNLKFNRGLRINTLKCTRDHLLAQYPFEFSSSVFCQDGFTVSDDGFHPGTDPLHHAGAYYMQEPSAMSAVTVLAPCKGERVLDLCAAPGGKSTQIASALQGTGLLWSNEYVSSRARILKQNLERCGVSNSVISNCPPAVLCSGLPCAFDAVLVDAPCSGEGMFRKEPAALEQWSLDNIRLCADRQKEILESAALSVRPGGRFVYSTCTFAPEENECNIGEFLLSHPDFELMDCGVDFGQPAFEGDVLLPFCNDTRIASLPLSRCRRIFPYHGGEGHFIALLQRRQEAANAVCPSYEYPRKDSNRDASEALYTQCFYHTVDQTRFVTFGQQVSLLPPDLPSLKGLGVISAGIAFADVCKNRLEPCHWLFTSSSPENCRELLSLSLSDERVNAYLHGETIEVNEQTGWTAVAVENILLGFGKASGGILKNRYPKGIRI